MAKGRGGLCVTLQEFPVSLKPREAHYDAKGRTVCVTSDAGLLSLLKIGSEEFRTDILDGVPVSQFVWGSPTSDAGKHETSVHMFAVLTRDGTLQLHSIADDNQSVQLEKVADCSCDAVKTAAEAFSGTEFSSPIELKILALQGSLLTVLIESTVCRLALSSENPVEILQCYQLKVEDISKVRYLQGMVVVLQRSGIISFHSLDKKEKIGVVNVKEHVLWEHPTSDVYEDNETDFEKFDIAEDLTTLVVCDSRNNVIPVDLNVYFKLNAQHLLKKKPVEGASGDQPSRLDRSGRYRDIRTDSDRRWLNQIDNIRLRCSQPLVHSDVQVGCQGVGMPTLCHQTKGRSQNWYEDVDGIRVPTKWVRTRDEGGAMDQSDGKVVSGFLKRRSRTSSLQSQSSQELMHAAIPTQNVCVILPSPVNKGAMQVSNLYVNGTSVLVWYVTRDETQGQRSVACVFDLGSGCQELSEFTEPACVAFSPVNTHPHLIITKSCIAAVAMSEEQEGFVNKLMMYDSATVADSVCRVNRWDRCSIPIHALEIGLRHRQLDTVAFFLKSRESVFTMPTHFKLAHPSSSPSSSSSNTEIRAPVGILGASTTSPFRSQMDTFQLDSAVELLTTTIRDNINSDMQSRLFGAQLLHMTLEFVNYLLRNATLQALRLQQEGEGVEDEDLKSTMEKLIRYISELRQYLKDVPEWCRHRATPKQVTKPKEYKFYAPEKSNFTERCLKRWKHMTRQDIIQDAIVNSCVPLVQAYLHEDHKTDKRATHGQKPSRLKDIIEVGLSEVYRSLLQRNLRMAAKMLNSMGYDVTEQLRKICLYTSNRSLRDFLIEELEKSKQLSEEELKMVAFVRQVEHLYSCQSYQRAKEIAEETRKSYWENTFRLSRIPTMQAKSVLTSLVKTGDLERSELIDSKSDDGYSHIILEWVRNWDEETRQRILLDRAFHGNDSALINTFDLKTRWRYLLSHNLWDKIQHWLTEDSTEITAEMLDDMSHCTPFVRDKILDEMAKRGLFSSEELASFEKLLRRLSRSGCLLVTPHIMSNTSMMKVEDFHKLFIEYCLQHNLPNVLYCYLDFYRIAIASQEIQQLLSLHKDDIPWFEMLLFFREIGMKNNNPSVMFQASLANSRIILQTTPVTVTGLLEAGRPLAAMATLVYAPGTLSEVIQPPQNEDQTLWKVSPELLKKSLQSYPKLQSALFPVQTADGVAPQDITMYQLLKGNSPFDPSRLFRWQSTNNMSPQNNGEDAEMPHFSRPDLVSKFGHKEVLRYTYYLRRGRPSFAFITFVKSLGDSDATQIKRRMKQAYCKAYMLAMTNFTTTSICAACTAFVEMLGHDSLPIRVDLQSGNLIYSHRKKTVVEAIGDKKARQQKVKDVEDDMVSDFVKLTRHKKTVAEKLLPELEAAIVDSIKNAEEESTSLEAFHQWSLAVLFCHLHKLPYSSIYLEECAKTHQWLRFLCFAQNYQYPQYQILELIRNFRDANIREHLLHAVEHLQYTNYEGDQQLRETEQARRTKDLRAQYLKRVGIGKGENVGSSTDSDKDGEGQVKADDSTVTSSDTGTESPPPDLKPANIPKDLFGILFECEGKSPPWRALLACCVALRRPILAVLAACYKEAPILDCLCVWLVTIMDEEDMETAIKDLGTVQWHRWSLHDLSVILDVAIDKRYYSLLVKAFSVFDPTCALMSFFKFVEAYLVFHDGDQCCKHLRDFQDALLKCRRNKKDTQLACIGYQSWYEETAKKLTKILLQKCTTRYDVNQLLSSLTERNVTRLYADTDYVKVYTVFKLLEDEDIDLKMECFLEPSDDENKQYYQHIITTLQEQSKFDVAREFADIMDLPTHEVTYNKLLSELTVVQQSTVWHRRGGRETFWVKCHQTFHQHQTSPRVASNFFKTQATRQSSLVQQVFVQEREQLLGLAHHWLAKEQPPVPREEVEELERQIWRCRIQIEVERSERSDEEAEAMKIDEMFQLPEDKKILPDFGHLGSEELLIKEKFSINRDTKSVLTNAKEIKALDKLIQNELEKYRISQALKLAKQFRYFSEDLAIVMTCLQLAQGTLTVEQMDELMKEYPRKDHDRRKSLTWHTGGLTRQTSFASLSSFQCDNFTPDVEDIVNTMETIAEHCILGKSCCYKILNCYTIGQVLNKSYETIVKQDCFDVLREVLTSEHAHRFPIAKTYIQSSGIKDEELAGFLSDAITHSLSVFTRCENDDAPDSSEDLIFSPVENKENFVNLMKLCDNPAVLGNRLLDTAASLASSNTGGSDPVFAMEVELLVRGHQCHSLCYNMEGIASALRTCRSRSVVLAAEEEYSLLVRLLTGVGRYSEMTYIFDILTRVQQFELLFRKGIKDDKLKVAMLDYLKRYCPDDKEIFTMVALKFSMHREIAELHEMEAKKCLQHIQSTYKNVDSNPELQTLLQNVLQFYADAAESYVKVGCLRHAEKCAKKARLLALQIHLLSTRTRVINLSQRDVNIFIAKHPRFPEAYIVSDAYNKHPDWSSAVYNNVVVDGDFRYLEDFKAHLPLPSSLLSEVATRYKHESSKSSATTANMKKLLSYFSDIELQYRLATQFGFNEIAMGLLQGEGGPYLRDIV